MNVTCSGFRNRSNVAKGRSWGSWSSEEAGVMVAISGLRRHDRLSPGAQRPCCSPEGPTLGRRAGKAGAPVNTHPLSRDARPPPATFEFLFHFAHSSHLLFCSLSSGLWILPSHLYQGNCWAGLPQKTGPRPTGSTTMDKLFHLSEPQFFYL